MRVQEQHGKIGLMYITDYTYAAPASTCSRTTSTYDYEENGCANNDWLNLSVQEWFITRSSWSSFGIYKKSGGINETSGKDYSYAIRPTFYTDSSLFNIYFGIGTNDSPYRLVDSNELSFKINGTTYYALEGMNWIDWINSPYNTDGYVIFDSNVHNSQKTKFINQDITSLITSNSNYAETNLTSITISSTPYKAKPNMTWQEWVASEYNINGYLVHKSKIYRGNYTAVVTTGSTDISPSDIVTAGTYLERVVPLVNTFTFTINGTTYTSEENMTWSEWVNTAYNTLGLTISGGEVRKGNYYISPSGCYGCPVSPTDVISTNGSYATDN